MEAAECCVSVHTRTIPLAGPCCLRRRSVTVLVSQYQYIVDQGVGGGGGGQADNFKGTPKVCTFWGLCVCVCLFVE